MAKQLAVAADPFLRKDRRPTAPWVGWFRGRGRRWQKVAEAKTERECWRLLNAYENPLTLNCERVVLRAGVEPVATLRRG